MSRYENYEIKNNVFGTLSAPISSLATTIQLWDWQGQRFSENMLATLENIENWKVMKREIVLITAINWDTLTVERKYKPCPANDDANTQWQVSYAFSADDTISAYIDKEHFDKIDDSINDIYDNWVNKLRTEVISWLQIKVNAWPVLVWSSYYDFEWWNLTLTDNATNYIEIDEDGFLVSNTTSWTLENTKIAKVITSSGVITSIEDWRLGTVWGKIWGTDIHELTEKTSLSPDDEFIVSDSDNIYNNKKIKAKTMSDTIWTNNKLNINFVLISGWWAGWRWYFTNGASGGWWWWQIIEWKAVLNRWWEYNVIIWVWWQTNWASGGWSLFLWYFCYWWWGGGSWDGISGANWWWGGYANGVKQWAEPTNYHPLITWYRWWNWNSFAWWWGWGAWWAWWNWIRQGAGWLGWTWISNNITWISVEYCKWWVGWYYDQRTSWDDGVNYWDWWWWTWYSAGSWATWWKWKSGALIISYPETNDFTITGATTSFVSWWNQVHIFETTWTLTVN